MVINMKSQNSNAMVQFPIPSLQILKLAYLPSEIEPSAWFVAGREDSKTLTKNQPKYYRRNEQRVRFVAIEPLWYHFNIIYNK